MNTPTYALPARILHWLMALLFLIMWISGYSMANLISLDSPVRMDVFNLHKSTGVTLLALCMLRIAVRLNNPPPPLSDKIPVAEQRLAALGHTALYALPILIVILAWARTDMAGYKMTWFSVTLPKLFPTLESLWGIDLKPFMADLHTLLVYLLLALTFIHVAAVVKHRRDGHDVLGRMSLRSGNTH